MRRLWLWPFAFALVLLCSLSPTQAEAEGVWAGTWEGSTPEGSRLLLTLHQVDTQLLGEAILDYRGPGQSASQRWMCQVWGDGTNTQAGLWVMPQANAPWDNLRAIMRQDGQQITCDLGGIGFPPIGTFTLRRR